MIYKVQKSQDCYFLIEQIDDENCIILDTDPEDYSKWEELDGKELEENEFKIEERNIGNSGFINMVAKFK